MLSKLLENKITQVELVRDRGYTLPEDEVFLLDESINEEEKFKIFLSFLKERKMKISSKIQIQDDAKTISDFYAVSQDYSHTSDSKRKLLFYFLNDNSTDKSFGSKKLIPYGKNAENEGISELIFLINKSPSQEALHWFSNSLKFSTQFFRFDDFVNPTKNIYYSKHELILSEELAEVKKSLRLTGNNQMPLIDINDPIVIYFNWKEGSIIKIHRQDSPNGLCKKSIAYRKVNKS